MNEDRDESYPAPTINRKNTLKLSNQTETDLDFSQWQVGPNGKFRAATRTISNLHPGVYKVEADDVGPFLQLQSVISDNIVELPETANTKVLDGMKVFWKSKDIYERFGLIYKRGVLLWGPPGSGKTVTINLLMKELISLNGIVLICGHPDTLQHMLKVVRRMEPDRPIIVVFEDIDEIIEKYGEHTILSMLDGENQIANVVYIATTNYPDKLGPRITNRPSRFDERIFVGMPSALARKTYLKFATMAKNDDGKDSGLDDQTLDQWTKDTEDFSVAHLRELVVACFCLGQEYPKVLKRLKKMMEKVKVPDSYRRRGSSFMAEADEETND